MRTRNLVFSVFALLLFASFAYGQVTGVVVDDFGPIQGAIVTVDETGVTAETDDVGAFSITANIGDNLSILNPNTLAEQKVAVVKNNLGEISINDASVVLSDVVSVGYTEKAAETISSAVSVVSSEELERMAPSTSVDNMLQGKAAGVQVTSQNGKPGQTAVVRIRGLGSLSGGGPNAPLYVVDGTYMSEDDLASLNPSDINTMSVLKDAAAASIYGSRAANGVVVITTKRGIGNKGKAKFTYTSKYGWGEKTDEPFDMMNAAQKLEYERQLYDLGVSGISYRTGEERNQLASYDHDWQDDLLRKSRVVSHAFTVAGAGENTNYFTSLGYDKNTGIVDGIDGFERISGRVNLDTQANDWFKIGTSLAGAYTTSDEPRDRNNVQNPFRAMYDYNPYETFYERDADGNIVYDDNGDPVWNRTRAGFSIAEALRRNPEEERNLRLLGNMYATVDIIDNLSYTSRISANYDRYQREYYMMPNSILNEYVGDPAAPGSKTDNGSDHFKYSWYNGLNYDFTLNDEHNFNILGFTEWTEEKFHSYRLASKGYSSPNFTTQENGTEPTDASTTRSKYNLMSYAATLDYDFDERYLFSAAFRRDASSRFGEENKWGNFYAFSLGWNIAEETFMENVDFVDVLKLRGSYGTRGSDQFPQFSYVRANYIAQDIMFSTNYGNNAAFQYGYVMGNPELKWESVVSTNVGLEFSLFNRRLKGVVDYFKDVRKDFLYENELSYVGGGNSTFINAGEMSNEGVELELRADIIRTDDFNWNVFGNISFVKPTIESLNGGVEELIPSSYTRHRVDAEPFTYYLIQYAGVDPANGDALYYTENGSVTNNFNDATEVFLDGKSPNPDYYGGFGTSISYKGFDVSSDFTYQQGNYILNLMAFNMLSDGDNATSNQRVDAFNYWQQPGDVDVLPAPGRDTNQVTDRWLQDGSFLRWRSLSIGYTLDENNFPSFPIDAVRISFTAQNLATWTAYEGDPEISLGSGESQGSGNAYVPGEFALYSYPNQRTYLVGLQVSF